MKHLIIALWAVLFAFPIHAQSWVQIESHKSRSTAETRARNYAAQLPDVNGFRASSGWFAIALGPYPKARAEQVLANLKARRAVPQDSFVSDGDIFREAFLQNTSQSATAAPRDPLKPNDQTEDEARASESALDRTAREDVQRAMEWFGHYAAKIDGDFGPGTRRAMASWQAAENYEATGVLTLKQRDTLMRSYRDTLAKIDLRTITDTEAGIEITMPLGLVAWDGYQTPFARYASLDDSGVEVLLISQPGDETTLFGLYEIMQTLDIIPPEGTRSRQDVSFVLTGQNNKRHSYAQAKLIAGQIKGFVISYPAANPAPLERITKIMADSFVAVTGVLDDRFTDLDAQSIDLISGVAIRKPSSTASGFFINGEGAVATHAKGLDMCERLTIGDVDATVALMTDTLAVLTPVDPIAPLAAAQLANTPRRLGDAITVAGFSFNGALDTATLANGTLEDIRGLRGEPDFHRIKADLLAGDAGGPVLDITGGVQGLLLPKDDTGKDLPDNVQLSLNATTITRMLSEAGIDYNTAQTADAMDPDAFETYARNITALVGCW